MYVYIYAYIYMFLYTRIQTSSLYIRPILLSNNTHRPSGTPFDISAEVRQGCLLSPVLYAVVAEVLLDNLEAKCPGTLVTAYADDTALVVEDIWTEGPIVSRLLVQFQEISGLRLNLIKCIFIPTIFYCIINIIYLFFSY